MQSQRDDNVQKFAQTEKKNATEDVICKPN